MHFVVLIFLHSVTCSKAEGSGWLAVYRILRSVCRECSMGLDVGFVFWGLFVPSSLGSAPATKLAMLPRLQEHYTRSYRHGVSGETRPFTRADRLHNPGGARRAWWPKVSWHRCQGQTWTVTNPKARGRKGRDLRVGRKKEKSLWSPREGMETTGQVEPGLKEQGQCPIRRAGAQEPATEGG